MSACQKTIFITDDDPAVLDGMQLILERAGYLTQTYNSTKQLLETEAPYPDLFLLDKQLCGIDGLDACRYLKAQANTAHIPVIIVSATPHAGRMAADAGADGFIEKPFQSAALLAMVRQHLGSQV